ncbi:hypothetical protein [Streptomyces sp. NPDC046939]|uniref:hypothetical protein n=1 Tax=Streptomyces sp. NPDC046939 TaxID=3155376 RepID=UPI0033F5489F
MKNIISGHAPGHIRNAFLEAVELAESGQPLRRKDWGRLWNCTDILPGCICDSLDLPRGSTYAQAVRSLI